MTCTIVVLASGTGSLCQALFDAIAAGRLDARVAAVVSDRRGAEVLRRAERVGVPAVAHPLERGADRESWDADLAAMVDRYAPDLVVSAGFMKLLGSPFLARFGGRTINTHPSLLPSFPGMHAVRDAIDAGVKVAGASVFVVDEGIDTGRLLLQGAVDVLQGDDVDSLHERIKVVERRLVVEAVSEWKKEHRE